MTTPTILDWIIANHYAANVFQATAIANGLHLADIHGEPELQQERVKLYRRLRTSGVYPTTAQCFAAAIRGERVPELELE